MNTTEKSLAYGAALSSVALMGSTASAAIINLSFSPTTVNYQGGGILPDVVVGVTGVPGGAFGQYNDGLGNTFHPNGGAIVGFAPFAFSSPISTGAVFTGGGINPTDSATATYGFITNANQVGWIRFSVGGAGGTVSYLAGAFNDTPGEGIFAGTTTGFVPVAPIPETSTTIALAGLSMLAVGVGLREKRRRKAKQAVTA